MSWAMATTARFPFYVWDERTSEVRWMCAWDATEDDVDGLASAVGALVDRARP